MAASSDSSTPRGEAFVWFTGLGLIVGLGMVVGLLALVLMNGDFVRGLATERATRLVGEWRELPLAGRADIQRGVGVVDMARSISSGEPHRASGELAAHVVELMAAFESEESVA